MKKFIFDKRNGIYIIDLAKTKAQIDAASKFLYKIVLESGSILFVGAKKQAQGSVKEAALRCGMPYVTERWLGGTLTNISTIRRSVSRLKYIDQLEKEGKFATMPKKEVSALRREQVRLHKNLDGILSMEKLPAALFVVDVDREANAVHEACRLKIPIVAVVDTNCDPDPIDYPIAGNDDAIKAIKLVTAAIADSIVEARAEWERRRPRKVEEEKPVAMNPPPALAPMEAEVPAQAV